MWTNVVPCMFVMHSGVCVTRDCESLSWCVCESVIGDKNILFALVRVLTHEGRDLASGLAAFPTCAKC